VLAVIALPVGDARPGDGRAKALGLRHGPHGHVAAVTPTGHAETLGIYRPRAHHFIHAAEDVAQVPMAEIFNVGPRELFSLPVAAARVGVENEVILCREE